MRTVNVHAHAGTSADAAFDGILRMRDEWRVPFGRVTIGWTQRSEPATDRRSISFTQVGGDFRSLSGGWRLVPAGTGCEVLFEARFDVGVPIYDRILDPLVEQALADHARALIAGLGTDALQGPSLHPQAIHATPLHPETLQRPSHYPEALHGTPLHPQAIHASPLHPDGRQGNARRGSALPGNGLPGNGLPGNGLPGNGLPGNGLRGERW